MRLRLFLLLIGTFFYFGIAHAQFFKGGILLGFNGCQVDGDNQSGYDKFGVMGGAFVFTPLSRFFDLQLEIEYMGKGAQSINNNGDYQEEFTIALNYIEIPVILRFNTIKNFGFEGGLGFGYLFSSSETLSTVYPTTQVNFKPFELSGIIGFNYHLNQSFSVIARYSYSFTPIAHTYTNLNDIAFGSGLYNNIFSIALGYQFP